MTTTADLLEEARVVIEREAECIKDGCEVRGRDWACADCQPETCGPRKQHADMINLCAQLKTRAEGLRVRDALRGTDWGKARAT